MTEPDARPDYATGGLIPERHGDFWDTPVRPTLKGRAYTTWRRLAKADEQTSVDAFSAGYDAGSVAEHDAANKWADEKLASADRAIPSTVAVPVELAKAAVAAFEQRGDERANHLRSLLPKPTPRLVAVDLDTMPFGFGIKQWNEWARNLWDGESELFPLLDGVIEEVGWRMYGIEPEIVTVLKSRLRAALGVTDAEH